MPNIERAVLSVHCHDDLGLGVANSLAAIQNGAGQVECTVNGIGERAGNASLEEIVMALKTRPALFGAATGIHTEEITRTSRLLSADHRDRRAAEQGDRRAQTPSPTNPGSTRTACSRTPAPTRS